MAGPIGPSDGFVNSRPAATGLAAGLDTVVAQLSLAPASSYIVTAATDLGNTAAAANLVSCQLLENFNPIGWGFGRPSRSERIRGDGDADRGHDRGHHQAQLQS